MTEKTIALGTHVNGTTEVFRLEYTWKIVNYSLLNMSRGQDFKSSIFSANEDSNIQWVLKIYPDGDSSAKKDSVSIFLEFCPTESRKEMKAQFELVMIGEQNHSIIKTSKWNHFEKEDGYSSGYLNFIKKKYLSKNGKFLPNDCLTIVCRITGLLSIDTIPNRLTSNFMDSGKSMDSSTQSGYQKLFDDTELTDVVLTASDGKQLHAHKAILAAHSPVFLAMITENIRETPRSELKIHVQFDILQEVLRFIYCDTVENMETFIYDLLAVSNEYAIGSLKFECEKYLAQNIKIDTAIEALSLADTYKAANLRKYAIEFFLLHRSDIVDTKNFKLFHKLQPDTIEELTKELMIRK